jgi:LacI family transcriptional regulator
MESKRVTIRQVARVAGVSTGTVSAVLNDRASVREETKVHVRAVMRQLGYKPSLEARRLAGLKTDASATDLGVGIVIKEVDNPFYAEVIIGAEEELRANGLEAFVCFSGGVFTREGELIESVRQRGMGGVIIAPVLHHQVDLSHLFELRSSGFPFTLLESVQGLPANSVSVDNRLAAETAVKHLLDRGHEHIVHFAGPAYTQHTRDRIAGVERAFSQSRVMADEGSIVEAGSSFRAGYEAAREYFTRHREHPPTGVTCFNDLVALGVLRALAEVGLNVPGDVSVVGFDDIPVAAYLPVPLTTIRVAQREMGRLAARNLIAQMTTPNQPPAHVLMESVLIERSTTLRLDAEPTATEVSSHSEALP